MEMKVARSANIISKSKYGRQKKGSSILMWLFGCCGNLMGTMAAVGSGCEINISGHEERREAKKGRAPCVRVL